MHYTIINDGEEKAYELTHNGDGKLVLTNGGEAYTLDVVHLPDGDVHLLLDGRSYDLSVALDRHEAVCALEGHRLDLHVYNSRQLRMLRLEEASGGGFDPEVRSPMAGKVIAVQVATGDQVEEGQALVVVEAMKMENIIRCLQPGRVLSVTVEPGQAVEPSEILVLLEPLTAGDE